MKIRDIYVPVSEANRNRIKLEIIKAKKDGCDAVRFFARPPITPYATFDVRRFTEDGRELLGYEQK